MNIRMLLLLVSLSLLIPNATANPDNRSEIQQDACLLLTALPTSNGLLVAKRDLDPFPGDEWIQDANQRIIDEVSSRKWVEVCEDYVGADLAKYMINERTADK